MPIWFDLALILSFAWTGLLFGFLSLMDLEQLLLKRFSKRKVYVFSTFLLFVSGFGIYLGRYLRWNSWDLIHTPGHIFVDVGHRLIFPWEHPRTWGMTIFMGIFLNMIYWSLKLWKKRR